MVEVPQGSSKVVEPSKSIKVMRGSLESNDSFGVNPFRGKPHSPSVAAPCKSFVEVRFAHVAASVTTFWLPDERPMSLHGHVMFRSLIMKLTSVRMSA